MICFGVDTDYLSNKRIYHGELKNRKKIVNNEGVNEIGNMHDLLCDAFRTLIIMVVTMKMVLMT